MRLSKIYLLTASLFFLLATSAQSQNGVGIGTENPNPNAILDLVSPTGNQGLLVPRLTTEQRTNNSFTSNLSLSDNGLMVFDSDEGRFYFWMSSQWVQVRTGDDLPVGSGLSFLNGEIINTGDLDDTNEIQDLTDVLLTGNDAGDNIITNLADPVNQSDAATKQYVDALDVSDADADPANELQDLELQGATLRITNNAGATDIDLAPFTGTNTDNQTLSLAGTDLTITGGNAVDLTSIQDGFEANTDNQDLNLAGTNLSISGGNSVNLSSLQDGFEADTDNQTLSLTGTTLAITGGNNVNLAPLQDGTGTDNQNLRLSGTDLSISGGNSIDVSSLQDGTGTDNQTLRLSGTNLSISSGNSIDVSSLQDGFEANTDNQNLSLSGNTLSLTGDATVVNLSGFLDNTDNQDLRLSGNTLSLTGDATSVNLSGYLDNTDDQVLRLTGTDLQISGGNTIDVSTLQNTDIAFKALAPSFSVGAGVATLAFTNEVYDISTRTGGSFDRTDFTAPVRGIYNFSGVFSGFFDTGYDGVLVIRVEGENRQTFTLDTNQNRNSFSFSTDMLLQAGDVVRLVLDTSTGVNIEGSSANEHNTQFSGNLVIDLSR